MRLEREDHDLPAPLTGPGAGGGQEGLVAQVDAVEVPHRHRGSRPVLRRERLQPDDLHVSWRVQGRSTGSALSITVPGIFLPASSTALSRYPFSVSA